jgi:hypothetical protein
MPRRPTKSTAAVRQWRITLVRAKGQYLGLFEAPDQAKAIAEAIKQFTRPSVRGSWRSLSETERGWWWLPG